MKEKIQKNKNYWGVGDADDGGDGGDDGDGGDGGDGGLRIL